MTWAMIKTLLLVLSGLLFCACGDDDSSVTDTGPTDAGRTPDVMEGMDAGPDTGPIEGMDAGPVEVDAGPVEVDAGPSDAGTDVSSSPDAGPLCFLNVDCPDDNLCSETEEGTDMSFCIPGDRGTTPYGDACTTSEQCVSGACLEDFCTMACDAADACPSPNLPRCQPALGLCVPPAE
ncbi:MAG: hypothetical protein ACI9KE_000857 [Polyangiales bacterium]|jgi:hypothetical protein